MKLALIAALSVLASLVFSQESETTVFTEQFVGLQFNHPSSWKTIKKEKDRVFLEVPVEGSSEPAELQIVHTTFHAEKDLWQQIQQTVNKQMKREIVRQWEQEILGVPMLFTRINYIKDGVSRSTLTGLFYTRTPQKMLVRLDTREADFDNVAYMFTQAMQTLRTLDGSMPLPDDPTVKLAEVPVKAVPVPLPAKVIDKAGGTSGEIEKPALKAEVEVSQRKVNLLYPEGWTIEKTDGQTLTLRHPDVSVPVTLRVFTTLDSDPPQRALFRASSESLKLYTKVDLREDTNPKANRAGAMVATVWRSGKQADGDLASFESTGQAADFYFLLSYQQPNAAAAKAERVILQSLVNRMSIEPVE